MLGSGTKLFPANWFAILDKKKKKKKAWAKSLDVCNQFYMIWV